MDANSKSENFSDEILDVGPLVRGLVQHRPSKVCRVGYVADVLLDSGELVQVRGKFKAQ
jgi:hypothetical protein